MKKIWKVFIIIAAIVAALLIWNYCDSKRIHVTSVDKYGVWVGDGTVVDHTAVFPQNLKQVKDVNQYIYTFNDIRLLKDEYQVFLDCEYTPENFNTEIERLKQIPYITYQKECTTCPAYILNMGDNGLNQYVLVDEDQSRLIYVTTYFIKKDKLKFSEKYLPQGYCDWGDTDYVYETRFVSDNEKPEIEKRSMD